MADDALVYGSGVNVVARSGNGRDPPGRAGRSARRPFKYSTSHSLCEPFDISGFGVADEAKNLRPEERRLGTLELACCWLALSEAFDDGIVGSVLSL